MLCETHFPLDIQESLVGFKPWLKKKVKERLRATSTEGEPKAEVIATERHLLPSTCLTFAQLHYPEYSSMPCSRLALARQEQPSLWVDGTAATDMTFSAAVTAGLLTQQPFSSTVRLGHTKALRYWRSFRAPVLEGQNHSRTYTHTVELLCGPILALQVF